MVHLLHMFNKCNKWVTDTISTQRVIILLFLHFLLRWAPCPVDRVEVYG